MAAISALTENFTGSFVGNAISETNTVFTNVSGQGTSTFITDPYHTGRMMEVNTGPANFRVHHLDFGAQPQVWFRFDIAFATILDTTTAVLIGYQDTSGDIAGKVFDLRQVVDGTLPTLQLRNVSVAEWASPQLQLNTKYRVYMWSRVNTSKQIRCMIYGGPNLDVLVDDSGNITSTTTATSISSFRLGSLSSSAGTVRFGTLRGDTTTAPFDSLNHYANFTEPLNITDSTTRVRGLLRAENLGMSDTVFPLVTGPSSWVYTKHIKIG